MSAAKTARWLDLVAYLLQHRFPVTREQVFEHVAGYGASEAKGSDRGLESARRKFERDKDELRALGIEIETVPLLDAPGDEPSLGYRLRPGSFYLPYLELSPPGAAMHRPYQGLKRVTVSPSDISILDRASRVIAEHPNLPLAEAARSARRKLQFDLPLSLGALERVLAVPLSEQAQAVLGVLQSAVASRTAVSCRYYAIGRDAEEEREIEPYGLFFTWSRWYCVARARDRNALRVFRVDRMRDARPLKGAVAGFRTPPGFSVREYLHRAPWELSEAPPTTVRVRFRFPESRWIQAQGVGQPVEPLLDDAGAVLEFAVRDMNPFIRWLLTFRQQATVLDPPSVIRALDELRRQVAALYAGSTPEA